MEHIKGLSNTLRLICLEEGETLNEAIERLRAEGKRPAGRVLVGGPAMSVEEWENKYCGVSAKVAKSSPGC